MNHSNTNNLRLNNEQLQLINILNQMYNDNIRNINSFTEMLNTLIDNNNQIRNTIIQLLGSNQNGNSTRRNTSRRWETINNMNTNSLGRVLLGNRPYIIDSISEYNIPLNNTATRNRRSTLSNEMLSQVIQNFLQPVEIYPTQDQIDTATRRVRYCDIMRPLNTSCPISMEEFNDRDNVTVIRHCGHIFHTENLMNWFRSNCRCPVCRYDIREYNVNISNEFFNNTQSNNDLSNNVTPNSNTNQYNFTNNLTNDLNNSIRSSLQSILNNVRLDINSNLVNDLSGNLMYPTTDVLESILFNALGGQ